MEFTEIPIYTDEQKKEMRLNACKICIFSECAGRQTNKCDINSLGCGKDNLKNIIVKTSDVTETCPMNYWNHTNGTRVSWPTKGCGCGK